MKTQSRFRVQVNLVKVKGRHQQGLWWRVLSTHSSLSKRSRVRVRSGTKSSLLGNTLPPNVGLFGANPNLVVPQCGYRTPNSKKKKKEGRLVL